MKKRLLRIGLLGSVSAAALLAIHGCGANGPDVADIAGPGGQDDASAAQGYVRCATAEPDAATIREVDARLAAYKPLITPSHVIPVYVHRIYATGAASETWDALALPVHFWIDADGIVRDGALGGIGPDIMARGLQTILPDVTVTP